MTVPRGGCGFWSRGTTMHLSLAVLVVLSALAVASGKALGVAAANPAKGQHRVLTTARAVHELPPTEAAKMLPVHLTATVEYYEPTRYALFVSDATGGVYVGLQSLDLLPMERGDLIEVDGETNASFRTDVRNSRVRILGRKGTLLAPHEADFRELMSGAEDCQTVSIRGTVRSASNKLGSAKDMAQLTIQIPGGLVRTYLEKDQGLELEGLIDAEVQLSGIAGGIFNGRGQLMQTVLYAADRRQLQVLHPAKVKPQQLPWTGIDDVLQTQYVEDRTQRVRVRGAVTFYEPAHTVVIQHDGKSLLAETYEVKPITLGEVVDVVGFAVGNDAGPKLIESQILSTGRFEDVKPDRATYEEAMGGRYSDGLVTLRGQVLSQLHNEISDTMVVMVEGHPVNVLLWTSDRPRLRSLPMNTVVDVTGVCHITKTDQWGSPVSFLLEMREPGDLIAVASASWWTVDHMAFLFLGLLLVSLGVTAWALTLRRRVTAQAERIQQSMDVERERGRLLEAINSQMPLPSLMEDICGSFEALVPGVHCSYELLEFGSDEGDGWMMVDRKQDTGVARSSMEPRRAPIFEAMMTETTGAAMGVFQAVASVGRELCKEEREALAIAASLANMALNQRRMYERLNFHSTHDPLTGLPNRRLSDTRLDEALREARRSGLLVGVIYIDIDRFKLVNDEFGHKTGDLYLQAISGRLDAKVRSGDLLARIGGDEFMLTAELRGPDDAELYRQRLQSCFEEPFRLECVVVEGSASIGLAVYPLHGKTAEELQRHADLDMYAAKEQRRTRQQPVEMAS